MLDKFWDFTVKLLFLKQSMEAILLFRPLGKTPTEVQAMLDEREPVRADYVEMWTSLREGKAVVRSALATGRLEAIRAYALMKSNYVELPDTIDIIRGIPKRVSSPKSAVFRMESTAAVWGNLPNPPGSLTPFTSNGLTKVEFIAFKDDLETKHSACILCQSDFNEARGELNRVQRAQQTFITRALAIGRAQFAPGTTERAIIDGIPTEPGTQKPGVVVFETVDSPAAGQAYLKVSAAHAKAFRIERKGPGAPGFVTVALIPAAGGEGEYLATGLVPGVHEFRVYGDNSQGEGPASAVQSLEVSAVGAPAAPSVSPPESLAPGEVHFQFAADGALSFEVWEKGPGASVYTLRSTVPATAGAGEYSASGQPEGVHWYKVRGLNAEGAGPFSAAVSLDVMEAAA